jgi:hypothetical protein
MMRAAERLAAEDYAYSVAWWSNPRAKPPRRGHPRDGDWRQGFNVAWNEYDREFGDKTRTVPPNSAMGLAGWLYFWMRNDP